MKRLFFLLLALIIIPLCFTACFDNGNNGEDNPFENNITLHTHEYGEWFTVRESGCVDNGEMARYCSCGEKQTEIIYAKGWHTEVIIEGYDSTCNEYGLSDGKYCSVCNKILVEQTTLTTLNHNFNTLTTPPTCTENGYYTSTCLDCGFVKVSTELEKTGHSFNSGYKSDNSFHWQKCDNCDYISEKEEHYVDDSGACAICNQIVGETEGIIYELSDDGSYAIVLGYSGAATKIKIAETYNGVPVTEIYSYAFYQNYKIESVIISDSVITIGDYAFSECKNLDSVVIGNSVTTIGAGAFFICYDLNNVVIGENVKTIGDSAFWNCNCIYSITIPDSVTTIGREAFYACHGLNDVTIGSGVISIGMDAFSDCPYLEFNEYENCKYLGNESNPYHALIQVASKNISTVSIHNDTKVIGGGAFVNCEKLKSIDLPNSIITISNSTFSNCSSLTSITIPNNVTTIEDYAFRNCDSLTSVVIPDSVTTIGNYTFYECDSLISVVIPDSVTTIGDYAFSNCSNLTSVVIGDGVTTISNYAFYECDSLTSVVIGNSVTTIGDWAFCGCTSLISVVIPDGVTTIGDSAFYGCDILKSVVIPDSVTTIGNSAFYECDSLTSVVIGNSVTTIGDWAFECCYTLTDVYYTGSESDWAKISIGINNYNLTNANIYYNYIPE